MPQNEANLENDVKSWNKTAIHNNLRALLPRQLVTTRLQEQNQQRTTRRIKGTTRKKDTKRMRKHLQSQTQTRERHNYKYQLETTMKTLTRNIKKKANKTAITITSTTSAPSPAPFFRRRSSRLHIGTGERTTGSVNLPLLRNTNEKREHEVHKSYVACLFDLDFLFG